MSDDIRSILDRLATVEGKLSPAQQRVPQLPALFKPHHIKALGAKTDPAHPMDGYMVGDSVEPKKTALEEAMAEIEEDMISKVKKDLTQYLDRLEKKVSINRDLKDKAKDAVEKRQPEEEIEEFAPPGGDDREPDEEEILRRLAAQWWNGTEQQMAKAQNTLAAMGWEIGQDESGDDDAGVFLVRAGDVNGDSYMAFNHSDLDLSEQVNAGDDAAYGKYADYRAKGDMLNKEINGGNDSIGIKTYTSPQFKNVVSDLTTGLAGKNPEMEKRYTMNKLNTPAPSIPDGDLEESPVATFEMDNGSCLECWGDDNQGYELRHGERVLPSRFKNLDHAGMAVKLYQARQRQQQPEKDLSQDYIEER